MHIREKGSYLFILVIFKKHPKAGFIFTIGFVKNTHIKSPFGWPALKNRDFETVCYKMHTLPNSVATLFKRLLKALSEELSYA